MIRFGVLTSCLRDGDDRFRPAIAVNARDLEQPTVQATGPRVGIGAAHTERFIVPPQDC